MSILLNEKNGKKVMFTCLICFDELSGRNAYAQCTGGCRKRRVSMPARAACAG